MEIILSLTAGANNMISIKFKPGTGQETIKFFSGALHLSVTSQNGKVKYKNPIIMIDKKIYKEELLLEISSTANIEEGDSIKIYAVQQRVRERIYEIKKTGP